MCACRNQRLWVCVAGFLHACQPLYLSSPLPDLCPCVLVVIFPCVSVPVGMSGVAYLSITILVSARPSTSVLRENCDLTSEEALFSRCIEWGLGAGAAVTYQCNPQSHLFTASCLFQGLQHCGPSDRSQSTGAVHYGENGEEEIS